MKKTILSLSNILLILFLLSNIPNYIYSQSFNWEKTYGPCEGHVSDLYIAANGNIYAGTSGGVFMSSNNGENWIYLGLADLNINAVMVNQQNTIYAGAYFYYNDTIMGENGVYYSTNNGLSWILSSLNNCYIYDLVKTNNGSIIATSANSDFLGSKVFRSTDNGLNWMNIDILSNKSGMEISISNNDNIFIALNEATIAKSTNDGVNWVITYDTVANGLSCLDATIPGYIFAGSRIGYFFRSTDNGNSWVTLNDPYIYKVREVKALSNGFVFTGTTYEGIWKSTNFGNNWVTNLYPDSNFSTVSCLNYKDSYLFSGFYNRTLFRSNDYGTSWIEKTSGLSASYVNTIFKTSSGNLLSGTENGLHLSNDNGMHWSRLQIGFHRVYTVVEKEANNIFAFGNKIWKSSNQGLDWQIINYPVDIAALSAIVNINGDIYFSSYGRIYKSTNNGVNWNSNFYVSGNTLSLAKNSSGHLFAVGHPKIYRSLNNGINWTEIYANNSEILGTIAVGPDDKVYVCTANDIIVSTDNGLNWGSMNFNHSIIYGRLLIHPSGKIIVSTCIDGIYYFDGNWNILNSGLDKKIVYSLGLNSAGQILAGTMGSGIYRSNGPIGITPVSSQIPSHFSLSQNYPNPFNPVTKIKFDLPAFVETTRGVVSLKIHDILGREVAVLVNEQLRPGSYEVDWDASAFPSGVYFYTITSGSFKETRKMVLLK